MWDDIKRGFAYIWSRRTTAFGLIQITIATLAQQGDLFSATGLKRLMLVNALLLAWLGVFNNMQIKKAELETAPP